MSERSPAVLTHVLGIFTFFLGPLVVYFAAKRNATPWLRDHLDESVNYNLLVSAAFIVLIVVGVLLGSNGLAIWFLLLALVLIPFKVLLEIVAAVKAGRGKPFHFPLDVKILK